MTHAGEPDVTVGARLPPSSLRFRGTTRPDSPDRGCRKLLNLSISPPSCNYLGRASCREPHPAVISFGPSALPLRSSQRSPSSLRQERPPISLRRLPPLRRRSRGRFRFPRRRDCPPGCSS